METGIGNTPTKRRILGPSRNSVADVDIGDDFVLVDCVEDLVLRAEIDLRAVLHVTKFFETYAEDWVEPDKANRVGQPVLAMTHWRVMKLAFSVGPKLWRSTMPGTARYASFLLTALVGFRRGGFSVLPALIPFVSFSEWETVQDDNGRTLSEGIMKHPFWVTEEEIRAAETILHRFLPTCCRLVPSRK